MTTLSDLDGTQWTGSCELWLDPLGNDVLLSDATLAIDGRTVHYTWSHEGKDHQGRITVTDEGADFTDTWHQPEVMPCSAIDGARGLFQVEGSYGPDDDWGWRIGLFSRAPSGELVLQMTNITPWGEEARAVRIVGQAK